MSAPPGGEATLVQSLATLLRNCGDSVLDGTSTLTLKVGHLQQLTRLFERHLLSRTQQHGFLALPSHPADTSSLLQLQLLFDILQKTVSLKLIQLPGSRLQSVVKIFPFKSLKYLELKRVPPHSLEGLRAVYSQLEVFICSKSLSSLEEILALCGGDLSSALPWLELHTLNFSYNSITSLDESLSLLNILKSLDLSHNRIQDCSQFLLPLTELEHLNLGYNFLQRAPSLGFSSRARLVTLILRNNELETINGVEQLSNLQHLDLAYNLLVEHSQLAPLSLLHCLCMLQLEGNPLYFQKSHRTSTVTHLSPKAALRRLKLDGSFLSSSELAVLPKSGQLIGRLGQTTPQVAIVPERGTTEVSSGGGDLSDSFSVSEPGLTRLQKKKSKHRVRVRRASISEPSDTDHEPRATSVLQDIVLHHQKEIERMDVFREQLGEDWLRYQHHLEGASVKQAELASGLPPANGHCVPASTHIISHPTPQASSLPVPLLMPEPKENGSDPETEFTLQWQGRSLENAESILETSLCAPSGTGSEVTREEEELGVDLCLPLLVEVLPDSMEEAREMKAPCPLFLRVKMGHVLEVDVHSGAVLARLELNSLKEVTASQVTWSDKGGQRLLPVIELHFSYISRARRKRCYVMLDDDPQVALQALIDILSRVAEDNGRQAAESEGQERGTRLQCLRCQAEFLHRWGLEEEHHDGQVSGTDMVGGISCVCPECGSDHVVQPVRQVTPVSSTPAQCVYQVDSGLRSFAFDNDPKIEDTTLGLSKPTRPDKTQDLASEDVSQLTDTFLTAKSSPPELEYAAAGPPMDMSLASSWNCSYSASQAWPQGAPSSKGSSPAQFDLFCEDFEVVDHRLKLYLDMEVFEDNSEELRCLMKMSVVKFGLSEEFLALLVVSNQCFYFLEVTSETQGQLSDWLRKRDRHRVADLCFLEVGVGSQSLHMQFEEGGATSYTLLVRNSTRCKRFFNLLTGMVRELASKSDSKLQSISTSRLHPRHHLWPLVYGDALPNAVADLQLHFFYLLAFVRRDGHLAPVTLLATQETLYLLKEDHQWSKSPSFNESMAFHGGMVTVQESQPISCVSSIHQFSRDPFHVDINLYDEVLKEEKIWQLQTNSEDLVQGLVDWVKTHWEAMFGVKLTTSVRESGP